MDPASINKTSISGWSSKEAQDLRFAAAMMLAQESDTILDVGCNVGCFLDYLIENHQFDKSKYVGLDINPTVISLALNYHPDVDFRVSDVRFMPITDQYDWCIASGIFNIPSQDEDDSYIIECIDSMFSRCVKGVVFNFLTDRDETQESQEFLNTFDLGAWTNYLTKKYSRVIVRSDYILNDATIFILK